ncbi:branched-chain amino acid aminotransferase [Sandaracinobacter sp. RS1-74]|uniref:branched-chain amino acid aminotransferase n=1 Tax=Sandaracinobacteroides sayramensis TaxID=2913411 RepID=UPI001EDAE502|nr:branched-chain amino acid aminotransferase [Sandaracinobacteroides sayramensis]MCG2839849.1 branched-chain amino acid aminotransferase [Sandaracinobacteroides sayramensis]
MHSSETFIVTPSASRRSDEDRARLLADAGFGRIFTDHMVTISWSREKGWHDARVRAREPFLIDPASAVLHYAQEIFEGMKAYRRDDGSITLFRPEENARRFNRSAARMAMPEIPESLFIGAIDQLLAIDASWVPQGEGSLYLRPFMFADEAFLGVRPADHYIFCLIASPAGAYFKGGAKPLTLWVTDQFSRAAAGGTGAAKCGGNYAGSLVAQAEATANGCDQVVFLDAAEHKWVEELGGMNIFFVLEGGEVRTPPLGTILPGITRASILELARLAGHQVVEDRYSFEEWQADAASGRLREVFVCGTAATVVGVGEVRSGAGRFAIGDGKVGPVTEALREKLLGIQSGSLPDDFGWCRSAGGK